MASMAFVWLSVYATLATRPSATLTRRRSAVALNSGLGVVLLGIVAQIALHG